MKWQLSWSIGLRGTSLKQKILLGLLLVVAIGTLSGGFYVYWLVTPPPLPTTAAEGIQLLKSPRYTRLPDYRQDPYLEQTRKLVEALPEEEKKQVFTQVRDDPALRKAARSAMVAQMMARAREFAQATPMARSQVVDKFIGMQEMFQQRAASRAGGQNGPARAVSTTPEQAAERQARREKNMAQAQTWIEKQIEHGNPQRQAYVSEFLKAIRDRRVQLGLDPNPAPPGRD